LLIDYSVGGYLSGWKIKEGYFNIEFFYQWFIDDFLSYYNEYPIFNNVIIMDNVNIYCDPFMPTLFKFEDILFVIFRHILLIIIRLSFRSVF
jgi:hypothetical protein